MTYLKNVLLWEMFTPIQKLLTSLLNFLLFLFIQSSVQLLLKVIGIDLLYYKKNNLFRSSE